MNNKLLGNSFEQEFCNLLARDGFWVHFIETNKSGAQPFDIVAGKDGYIYAFDCKTNKGNRFRLDRIEDNQQLAFDKFNRARNFNSYFAIKNEENIYIYPSIILIHFKQNNQKSVVLNNEYLYSKQNFSKRL